MPSRKGFTLLELLIVIGILAILSTAVVLVLNPAQLLAEARDSQRLADLRSVQSAIALYLTTVTSPNLAEGPFSTAHRTCGFVDCIVRPFTDVDGSGWVGVNLTNTTGGSPLAALPADPVNNATYQYAYAGNSAARTFELNTRLESNKFRTNMETDGGDKNACLDYTEETCYYEVGTEAGLDLYRAQIALVKENCSSFAPYDACFTSLAAWESAMDRTSGGVIDYAGNSCADADLICMNLIAVAQIEGTWSGADTAALDIADWTVGPQNFLKIYTAPTARHRGVWDTSKYRLEIASDADTIVLRNGTSYTRIDGLQVQQTTGPYTRNGIDISSGSYVHASNNLIRGVNGNGVGIAVSGTYQSFVYNNIIYENFGGGIFVDTSNSEPASYLYNNTVAKVTNCFSVNLPAPILKNNIARGCTDGYVGSFSAASDYNISDISADAPNATFGGGFATVNFADYAGNNFHLNAADTAAQNQGVNLAADATLPFLVDIDDQMRSVGGVWDIGADER